jgi:hypothetical protein
LKTGGVTVHPAAKGARKEEDANGFGDAATIKSKTWSTRQERERERERAHFMDEALRFSGNAACMKRIYDSYYPLQGPELC